MGYEVLLLLPLVWLCGVFLSHNSQKISSKIIINVLLVLFFLFFFLVYPSPVGFNRYTMRPYWRGERSGEIFEYKWGKMKRNMMDSIGIEEVDEKGWSYGEQYREFLREKEESGKD